MLQYAVPVAHHSSDDCPSMLGQHNDLTLGDVACQVSFVTLGFLIRSPRFSDRVLIALGHHEFVEVV